MSYKIPAMAILMGTAAVSPAQAAENCAGLAGLRIAPEAIGLPTRGAVIDKAGTFAAEKDLPATCRVNGRILAASEGAPPITFQINLPAKWNRKALQYGGGGFNGVLVDGLRSMPSYVGFTNPLARGFATFGSDGGHTAANMVDSSFGRIPEARENYMGAAVKRLRDAAVAVLQRYYGTAPRRVYYAGGSKGGHEGLVAAQRYGADFDGVISYYPAKDSVGLILGWGALTEAAYGKNGTPLSYAKLAFVRKSVVSACDGLDGLSDGVIANVEACSATISAVSLQCPPDAPANSTCLTPGEVATLETALAPINYPYPLANGVTRMGPFPVLGEADLDPAMLSPAGRGATMFDALGKGIVRDFWTYDANATFADVDFAKLRKTIEAHSAASDATSADIDAFVKHGGKLILVQGTTDMLVPPAATTDYFLRLSARYGAKARDIARYFVQPGFGHGTGPFRLSWDSLAALDHWVEAGKFKTNPIATDANISTQGRTMPLCEYPLFPRYLKGDPKRASSFTCSAQ